MHGSSDTSEFRPPRRGATTIVYGVLLGAGAVGLARVPEPAVHAARLPLIAVLIALAAGDYFASRRLRRVWVYDMITALALFALVLAGPLAAFTLFVVPDVIHLAIKRRAFWNSGLAANTASFAAAALGGWAVLSVARPAGEVPAILAAALAMMSLNYLIARLLLASLRDRRPVWPLIRTEFVATLPLQTAAISVAVLAALALPLLGAFALLGFAALVYMPQLALERLVRAPSAAALAVADASAVYRAAIVDELGLSRHDRRAIEQAAALVARRPEGVAAAADEFTIVKDALVVSICLETSPSQAAAVVASPRAQVVILAQRWAELTAKCTPALSHSEAMTELQRGSAARDAPTALVAARAIAERERALSEHIAGVPRLHRVPAPRRLRRRYGPSMVARLTA